MPGPSPALGGAASGQVGQPLLQPHQLTCHFSRAQSAWASLCGGTLAHTCSATPVASGNFSGSLTGAIQSSVSSSLQKPQAVALEPSIARLHFFSKLYYIAFSFSIYPTVDGYWVVSSLWLW